MRSLTILACLLVAAMACDIIVHLKSETDTKFEGQITASNGKQSEKLHFDKKKTRLTFQQKATECGLHDWSVKTWKEGKEVANVKVVLDGIGSVSYEVPDSLVPVMKQRNGAICKGDCAALG